MQFPLKKFPNKGKVHDFVSELDQLVTLFFWNSWGKRAVPFGNVITNRLLRARSAVPASKAALSLVPSALGLRSCFEGARQKKILI